MLKKVLIAIGIVALAALLFVVWIYITREPGPEDSGSFLPDSFTPFGQGGPDTRPITSTSSDAFIFDQKRADKLWLVTQTPTAAATFRKETRGEEVFRFIRYIERGTGHIYESEVSLREAIKLSNTTIPRIQEAFWLATPNQLVLRYLGDGDTIETFLGSIVQVEPNRTLSDEEQTNAYRIEGAYLEENILEIVPSPTTASVFYLTHKGGTTRGIIRNAQGGLRTIYTSPLKEVRPQWVNDGRITLTTKPSESVPGFLFFLDPSNETSRVILSGIKALITNTNPHNETILYYSNDETIPLLRTYSPSTGTIKRISILTSPEKCIWSRKDASLVYCSTPSPIFGRGFPDDWYQGVMSFSDVLWRLNIETGALNILVGPKEFAEKGAEQGVDGIQLVLDEDETHLSFVNKKDLSLWVLRLTE